MKLIAKVVARKLMVDCLYYQKDPTKDASTKIPGKFPFWRESVSWDTFNYRRGVAQCEIWNISSSARSQEFTDALTLTIVQVSR
ncbi:hypothetical protein D5086_002832 [Populus alba]|uniref:Uncharacterized protein n=1 Tax=Populus alba TaxID=43335 RepID=A0ACC4D2U5_POPAL